MTQSRNGRLSYHIFYLVGLMHSSHWIRVSSIARHLRAVFTRYTIAANNPVGLHVGLGLQFYGRQCWDCSLRGRRSLRFTSTNRLLVPPVNSSDQPSVAVLSRLLAQRPGTPCWRMQHLPSLSAPFAARWKYGFSRNLFRALSSDTDFLLTFSLSFSAYWYGSRFRSAIWWYA